MLTAVFLSALLMMGGLGEKSIRRDAGGQPVRRPLHQQVKNEKRRSLDLDRVKVRVTPPTNKISLPSMVKLRPPTDEPLHMYANMPMRFGRDGNPGGGDWPPNPAPNMPQRFGRSWKWIQLCAKCPAAPKPPEPQRPPYWSLLRTLIRDQLLSTGSDWAEELDFTGSSEELEMQGRTSWRSKQRNTEA